MDKILDFFRSIKLTVTLLLLLAFIFIVATLKFQDQEAIEKIYSSFWFKIIILLLTVNVLVCSLRRFSLKMNKAGTIVTHLGIILIFLTTFIGTLVTTKGIVKVNEGEAEDRILGADAKETGKFPFKLYLDDFVIEKTDEYTERLMVYAGGDRGIIYKISKFFGLEAALLFKENGDILKNYSVVEAKKNRIPWTDLKFVVRKRYPHGVLVPELVEDIGGKGKPLVLIEYRGKTDAGILDQENNLTWDESGEYAVKFVQAQGEGGESDGLHEAIIAHTGGGKNLELPVKTGEEIDVPGTGYSLKVLERLKDFKIMDGKPASFSDKPNNPAVQVEVKKRGEEQTRQQFWLFSKFPDFSHKQDLPVKLNYEYNVSELDFKGFIRLKGSGDGSAEYSIFTNGQAVAQGALKKGARLAADVMPADFPVVGVKYSANGRVDYSFRETGNAGDMPGLELTCFDKTSGRVNVFVPANQAIKVDGVSRLLHVEYVVEKAVKDYKSVVKVYDMIAGTDGDKPVEKYEIKSCYPACAEKSLIDQGYTLVENKVIEVNKYLKYRGYYFYQADYDKEGEKYSILSVKYNPMIGSIFASFIIFTAGVIMILWVNPMIKKKQKMTSGDKKKPSNARDDKEGKEL